MDIYSNIFISEGFIKENDSKYMFIKNNLINTMFPKLNNLDKQHLLNNLLLLINYINIKFNLSENIFWEQLIQNNMVDLYAIVGLMLPYIENHGMLKNLSDIYIEIDTETNKYRYSNMQYNRCIRTGDNKNPFHSREFTIRNLEDHLTLLLMSIETVSNKLHVNWFNILPITMDTFKTKKIYTLTKDKFKIQHANLLIYYIDTQGGISYQDFYNTITNHLYHEIVEYKWLIYELQTGSVNETIITYIEKNNIFNLDFFWNNKLWSQLKLIDQTNFTSNWNALRKSSKENDKKIVYYIHLFIQRFYNNLFNIDDDDDDIVNASLKNITNTDIEKAILEIEAVPIEDIYVFLLNQLIAFKKTWYYYYLKIHKNELNVTVKNIYNYAKLIATDKGIALPKYWNSLKIEHINIVVGKINNITEQWFNINNYLRRFHNVPDDQLSIRNKNIHDIIKANIVDIVFESMIYHGLLSEFVLNKKSITLEHRLSYENHAYYFMTGTNYGAIGPIKYFDLLISPKTNWYTRYAMNWVSQINFYHHYANNRVIYLTGGTGVGKSTIVPRLLMYSMHMIDYNNKGKIICTQPRIDPTKKNAITIAEESGVPITSYNKVYDKMLPTNNFHIQYKYKGGEHVNTFSNSFIKIVTDGTLFNEMIKYPFLTESYGPTWDKTYTSRNIYDIVIVDEAHEHNVNMDLILTLARDACYINNSIKLVIISATMEDDEPIYRRYYRDINDNRMFPLSQYIISNKLDRAIMDRRVHISEPKKVTQYEIKDIWLTKEESDKITIKNFVDAGIKKTIEVVNKTTDGDILLFMSGEKDLVKSELELNKNTPAHVICFKFIGTLTQEERDFITDIDKTLKTYTKHKTNSKLTVAPGTYKRAIIVATNVAEASITLSNLKYVIDTGYAKVDIYFPLYGINKLITMPISYTSSVQRKGRVGRNSIGYVYYLYDKNKVLNNKTTYKIADMDISDIIVNLLYYESKDYPIITDSNNINNMNIRNSDVNFTESRYLDIIINLYTYQKNKELYTYYGQDTDDDYEYQKEYNKFNSRNHTGYSYQELADNALKFYIIHPDENIINRNLYTGSFTGPKANLYIDNSEYEAYFFKKNKIDLRRIDNYKYIRLNLSDYIFPKFDIMVQNGKRLMQIATIKYENKLITIATNFAQKIKKIKEYTKIDIFNDILWYIYSLPYNMEEDVIGLINLLKNAENIKSIADLHIEKRRDVKSFFNTHNNNESDIYVFWKIWVDIKYFLTKFNLYNLITIDGIQLGNTFTKLTTDYLNNIKMNQDDYNMIDNMYKTGILDNGLYYYITKKSIDVANKIKKLGIINIIANKYKLNPEQLETTINDYCNMIYEIRKQEWLSHHTIKNNIRDDTSDIITNIKTKMFLPRLSNSKDPFDIIMETYIRAYSSNLVVKDNDQYITINSGLPVSLSPWSNYIAKEQTFLTSNNKYLIYHKRRNLDIYFITPVQPEWVLELNPIYYYYQLFDSDSIFEIRPIIEKYRKYLKSKYDISKANNYLMFFNEENIKKIEL